MFYGYILYSKTTHRYYTGQTDDLENRLAEHNRGESKSTRSGVPWEVVHLRTFSTRRAAMEWERRVKARGAARYLRELAEGSGGSVAP